MPVGSTDTPHFQIFKFSNFQIKMSCVTETRSTISAEQQHTESVAGKSAIALLTHKRIINTLAGKGARNLYYSSLPKPRRMNQRADHAQPMDGLQLSAE